MKIVLLLLLSLWTGEANAAAYSCEDLKFPITENVAGEIAIKAMSYKADMKQQIDVIGALCRKPVDDALLTKAVTTDAMTRDDVDGLAIVVGSDYSAKRGSEDTIYLQTFNKLAQISSLCPRCIRSLSVAYSKTTFSRLKVLIERLMDKRYEARALRVIKNSNISTPSGVDQIGLILESTELNDDLTDLLSASPKTQLSPDNLDGVVNRIKTINEPDAKTLYKKFTACNFKATALNYSSEQTLYSCRHEGIDWCDHSNKGRTDDITISEVTGQAVIKNPLCGNMLRETVNTNRGYFIDEFVHYRANENTGQPYTPMIFDITKFLGH